MAEAPLRGHISASALARPGATAACRASAAVPQRACDTLVKIDAGQWPPADAPGTKGGTSWPNRDQALRVADDGGKPIRYQEWDVNPKQPGKSRDGEGIVTGDDGSAWYSADNSRGFARMR
ncbi:ribonuclease domain-containing protein [Streptomyces violascens]|uniref:ribonuclease domain-containing protein n=2 Tax=Streptomyces violascens TaxID=67381 RepID=UPI00367410ED